MFLMVISAPRVAVEYSIDKTIDGVVFLGKSLKSLVAKKEKKEEAKEKAESAVDGEVVDGEATPA